MGGRLTVGHQPLELIILGSNPSPPAITSFRALRQSKSIHNLRIFTSDKFSLQF